MVLKEQRDGFTLLTLDRPERLNALDRAGCVELAQHIRAATTPLVINGNGRAFCAGVDLKELEAAKSDPGLMPELLDAVQNITRAIYDSAAPVAVAMHGYAVGMGLELALCADVRVAHADTKFAFPERLRNVEVTNAASWTLPQIVGAEYAESLYSTARQFTAHDALSLHILHALADDPVDVAARLLEGGKLRSDLRTLTRVQLEEILQKESERML